MADNETDNKANPAAGRQAAQGQTADLQTKNYNIEEGQEDCSCSAKESGGETAPAPNPDLNTPKEDSCVIRGKSRSSSCNADRLWLCYDIYEIGKKVKKGNIVYYTAGPQTGRSVPRPIPKQFAAPLAKVKEDWNIEIESDDNKTQFKARLYRPKAEIKCNPTVVFRGSLCDDFSGFGIYIKLTIENETMLKTVFTFTDDSRDKGMMKDNDYVKKVLINESGSAKLTNWIPLINRRYMGKTVSYTLNITIGASNRTSWGNNIRQIIMGNQPPKKPSEQAKIKPKDLLSAQYMQAAEFGQEIALKIKEENEKNEAKKENEDPAKAKKLKQELFFAGHSLGGSLAACAAHWAQKVCPDLPICGMTYNAAGLYPNSVPGNYGYAAPFFDLYVEDEILSTSQLFPRSIPFLANILRIMKIKLPQPYGCRIAYPPLNPEGKPRGKPLPKLWPVEKETLSSWPHADAAFLHKLDNMLFGRDNMAEFVGIIGDAFYNNPLLHNKAPSLQNLFDKIRAAAAAPNPLSDLSDAQENMDWDRLSDEEKKILEPQLKPLGKAADEYEKKHPQMPFMTPVTPDAAFVAAAAAFLIKPMEKLAIGYGAADYLQNRAAAEEADLDAWKFKMLWSFYVLKELLIASNNYHGMDVVAQSILNPRKKHHSSHKHNE